MKNLRGTTLSLILLCTPSLFAQSAASKREVAPIETKWTLARKNMQTVYTAFIHSALRNERSEFSDRMVALLDATSQIQHARQDMLVEPGAPYRDLFTSKTVMCQRSAIDYWRMQDTNAPDRTGVPIPTDVVTCMKLFAQPDPDFNR